jgi:endonuclease/exonuclease/phosphatase family metal-dependent hydrolase
MVHFITVYQAVAKDTSGPYTAFQQQLQCLHLANRDLPPRQAFLIDFEKYIKSLQTPSSQFVVMGDFNKVVGTSMSRFAKITSEFLLVDSIGHFHSVQHEDSTYARGPNQLNYVFCSNTLLSAVVACGAEPFNQHIFSDH